MVGLLDSFAPRYADGLPWCTSSTIVSWNSRQPLGGLVGLDRRRELLVDRSNRLVECVNLTDERTKRAAHAIGNHNLAILVENRRRPYA
jgi:hypothetical protein